MKAKVLAMCVAWVALSGTFVFGQEPLAQTEFTAAVIEEQNVTFAVVIVKPEVFQDKRVADQLIETFEPSFGAIPVVLMKQDDTGRPSYYGRTDIAEFLSNVPLESIPWKQYVLKEQPAVRQ